jgi:hypothetical protein
LTCDFWAENAGKKCWEDERVFVGLWQARANAKADPSAALRDDNNRTGNGKSNCNGNSNGNGNSGFVVC